MSNKNLIGKNVIITDEINYHLKRIFNAYKGDKNVEGYSRLKNLCDKKEISYEQLKRIKNFFDNFNGNKNETVYILNGGTKMKIWVCEKLDDMRDNVNNKKRFMSDIGMNNQFQKDEIKLKNIKINNHDSDTNKILRQEGIYRMKVLDDLIIEINKNKELCLMDNK